MRLLPVTVLLVSVVAAPLAGQRIPAPFPSLAQHAVLTPTVSRRQHDLSEPPYHRPLLTAAGLGLVGFFGGALAGHAIQGDCVGEFCEFEGYFYGAAAGGGLGLAYGAHIGNNNRGSLALDVLVSGVVWGAGFALMSSAANGDDGGRVAVIAIGLPIVQLLATVATERVSGRARHPESP